MKWYNAFGRCKPCERSRVHRLSDPTCERKTRHVSEEVARAAGVHILETGNGKAKIDRLWVYRCTSCRGWHLTKNGYLNQSTPPVTATEIYAQ